MKQRPHRRCWATAVSSSWRSWTLSVICESIRHGAERAMIFPKSFLTAYHFHGLHLQMVEEQFLKLYVCCTVYLTKWKVENYFDFTPKPSHCPVVIINVTANLSAGYKHFGYLWSNLVILVWESPAETCWQCLLLLQPLSLINSACCAKADIT